MDDKLTLFQLWEKYPPGRYHYTVKLNGYVKTYSVWRYFGELHADYVVRGNIIIVYIIV